MANSIEVKDYTALKDSLTQKTELKDLLNQVEKSTNQQEKLKFLKGFFDSFAVAQEQDGSYMLIDKKDTSFVLKVENLDGIFRDQVSYNKDVHLLEVLKSVDTTTYANTEVRPELTQLQQGVNTASTQTTQQSAPANTTAENTLTSTPENKPEQQNTTPEQKEETLTEEERLKLFTETLQAIVAAGGLKYVLDETTGQRVVTITETQRQNFERLHRLTRIVEKSQNGRNDNNPHLRQVNRLNERIQVANDRGWVKKTNRLSRKLVKMQEERTALTEAASMNMKVSANLTAREMRNRAQIALASGVNQNLHKDGYDGITYQILPFSAPFMDIAQNITSAVPTWSGSRLNIGGGYSVEVAGRSPSRSLDNYVAATNPTVYKECNVGKGNILEELFLENTKMSPEQARKNANLLTTGGLLVGGFFLIKSLFSGKEMWKGGPKSFLAKAATIIGGALGLNILSQATTGQGAMDMIKKLWRGDIKFSQLLEGKINGVQAVAPEYIACNAALRGVPYSALSTMTSESGGSYSVDVDKLEKYLSDKIASTSDINQKNNLQTQLTAVQNLKKDPAGKDMLNRALTSILTANGISRTDLSDPTKTQETLNSLMDGVEKRRLELSEHLSKNSLEVANITDADVQKYITTGKPTISELAAAGKFRAVTNKPEANNSGVEAKQETITDPALQQIDPTIATALQKAINTVNGTTTYKTANDRPTFEYKNNILYVRSYGLDTPISYADGTYKIGTLEVPFTSAENAIKTASLVNFLILTNNGAWDNDTPFSVDGNGGDIKVGNESLTGWSWFDKSRFGTWMNRYLGKTEAVDNDDWKIYPWRTSTLRDIGGVGLASVGGVNKFVAYLNGMKNQKGSIWNKNSGGVTATSEIAGVTAGVATTPARVNAPAGDSSGTSGGSVNTPAGGGNATPEKQNTGPTAWEKMTTRTKEKRDGFKNAVSETFTTMGGFVTGLFTGDKFNKPESAFVKQYKDRLAEYKKQLADFKKVNAMQQATVADAQEIGQLQANIQEMESQLHEIENLMKDGFDDRIGEVKNLTEDQKKELSFNKKRLNLDMKFKQEKDRARLVPSKLGNILLVSCKNMTEFKQENGNYYIIEGGKKLDIPLAPYEVLKVANLTNFIKANFKGRASANVNQPWKETGGDLQFAEETRWEGVKKNGNILGIDTTVLDGGDNFSSTAKALGGTVLQSQMGKYAQFLNGILDTDSKSYWVQREGHGVEQAQLEAFQKQIVGRINAGALNVSKGYRPASPWYYKGTMPAIVPNAVEIDIRTGYPVLKTHVSQYDAIAILQDPTSPGKYKIGYPNNDKKGQELVGNILDVSFPTLDEALRVGNLVNYLKKTYPGYGSSKNSFNISNGGNDLEFSQKGITAFIDIDALPDEQAKAYYSETLSMHNNLNAFKDWLNKFGIWKAQ